jgi:arylsulfatase
MLRWPGHIKAGSVENGIISHLDFLPTLLAAAGVPDVTEQLLKGMKVGNETFKVHLDGYNMLPYLTGQTKEDPRKNFMYFSDEADLMAMRYDNFKVVFMEQRAPGTMQIWAEPFVTLRLPKIYNLRTDPYERADVTSNTYWDWIFDHAFIYVPVQTEVGKFLETFKEYPPSQKTGSFSVDKVIEQMQNNTGQH